jgi:hypothetical protein
MISSTELETLLDENARMRNQLVWGKCIAGGVIVALIAGMLLLASSLSDSFGNAQSRSTPPTAPDHLAKKPASSPAPLPKPVPDKTETQNSEVASAVANDKSQCSVQDRNEPARRSTAIAPPAQFTPQQSSEWHHFDNYGYTAPPPTPYWQSAAPPPPMTPQPFTGPPIRSYYWTPIPIPMRGVVIRPRWAPMPVQRFQPMPRVWQFARRRR